PAQAKVVEKHDDGSAGRVEVRFLIDALAKGRSTELVCHLGRAGPRDTDLRVARESGTLVLSNRHIAVKLLDRNVEKADGGELSPLLGVRTAAGRWTGAGYYRTQTAKPVGSRTELREEGPVRLAARVTTTFDNGRTHTVTATLLAGSRCIDIDESFDLGPDDK